MAVRGVIASGKAFLLPVMGGSRAGEDRQKARAPCMILIEPDNSPTGLTASIDVLQRQLADLRDDLDALLTRIKEGEFGEIKQAARITSELRQWLKIAFEAEVQIETRNKRAKGIAYDYAIDLDNARAAVCRRLDSLARATDG
jgi:hypothetical protein